MTRAVKNGAGITSESLACRGGSLWRPLADKVVSITEGRPRNNHARINALIT